ncbi:MAG: DUF6891 domain-containing protein [Mycobacterium sp.]
MLIDRFLQRNNVIPDALRYGTLTRALAILASDERGELDSDEAASYLVRPGYLGAGDCVAILESTGVTQQRARQSVERQWSRYRDHLAQTPGAGDWERFETASDAMTAHGVLVRHNFTCCRTCADEEIKDERSGERPEWGYVYFTQMDAFDLAAEAASVWLGYGSFGPNPRITATELERAQGNEESLMALYERTFDHLAEVITASLTDNGLHYDWDGDTQGRIKVVEMDWRRPLPTDTAEPPPARTTPTPSKPQKFGFGFQ